LGRQADSVPDDFRFRATAEIIRQNVTVGLDTYVNVNNYCEGCAPLSIGRLLEVLRTS
jgi:hypothetical protein